MKNFIYLFLISFSIANNFYLVNDLTIGYDSNPMKLSEIELNESTNDLFLNKYSVNTKYIKFSSKIKTTLNLFSIFKRKTKVSLGMKLNKYSDLDEKTNFGVYFNSSQPLGKFQTIKFTYTYIPDIFLRQYDDADAIHQFLNNITIIEKSEKCYFDLSRSSIYYEFPFINRKNKAKLGYYNETQYYNKYFTEFDLDIKGYQISFLGKINNSSYDLSYQFNNAENITFLNGSVSTFRMDRGYKERGFKISLNKKIEKLAVGLSVDSKKRSFSSDLPSDNLHRSRSHKDKTFSTSLKFKVNKLNHRIKFSLRERTTKSPYNWVEELKTFKRYDLSYTVYFKKILLGKNK